MSLALAALRKNLRQKRRQLNRYQQRQAERACLTQLTQLSVFNQAQHIGLYLDAFGEVPTGKIISACFQRGKSVYLPRICNMSQRLHWVRITAQHYHTQRFSPHRLGMLQPMNGRGFQVNHLDLLIMPLLACDASGLRLGMGGGFYDRTLALATQQPFRLGLAHEFQFLSAPLAAQPWDQALDGLLTTQHFRRFKRQTALKRGI
ncbi:5-formyltetrahydrofolate cyclo-ligase [Acinetobacter calcoaceticus]|uniref:5-formyltetrahydrofolate cyclo-ligase n=1 Tax=Acinetobacter calcoaceticus TaxID=471 RepID=A0A4R1Y4H8_ACICA|nr:5-formyltetrahydrofolate cyclo-ligase [Acinetobacter calcoaceticus]